MDCSKIRKGQGRITINVEASEKLQALFSQESDTSLVFSVAECSENPKGDAKTDHSTSSTSTTDRNFINTCVKVDSLPKIVITPPPANGNGAEKKGVVASSTTKEHSPPLVKFPLLPISLRRQSERIRYASSRRTPASSNVKKSSQPPIKLPLLKPERISSASLRRKQPFISNRPSPIDTSIPPLIKDKQEPKSTAEQPSPSNNNTEQNQSDFQAAGEEVKGVQCPTPSTTYDVSSCIASGL